MEYQGALKNKKKQLIKLIKLVSEHTSPANASIIELWQF